MKRAGAVHGRADEIAVLRGLLDRALAFEGRSLALVGPPGVGKSTILGWVAAETHDRGFDVRTVCAGKGETDVPFAGLLTLLRSLAERIAELPGAVRLALQPVVVMPLGGVMGFSAVVDDQGATDACRLPYQTGSIGFGTPGPQLVVGRGYHTLALGHSLGLATTR